MLLLGQLLALVHPLSHLAAPAPAVAQHDSQAPEGIASDCDLCLGSAALAHLASACTIAAAAPPSRAAVSVAPTAGAVPGPAAARCRNRGPPAMA